MAKDIPVTAGKSTTLAPRDKPEGRVVRKRNERIRQILRATAEVLADRGFHAMNLDDVADRMDLTKATLYHYFPSKQALISTCIEQLGNEVTERLEALASSLEGSPTQRLRALLQDQAIVLLHDYPETARLFLRPDDWPEPHLAQIKKLRKRHNDIFRRAIEDGVRAGEFRVVHIDMTLHCLHGALDHAPRWYKPGSQAKLRRTVDRLVDTVMMMCGMSPDDWPDR